MYITAPDYLLHGQAGVFQCKSGSSNPPAEIEWRVRSVGGDDEEQSVEVDCTTYIYKCLFLYCRCYHPPSPGQG